MKLLWVAKLFESHSSVRYQHNIQLDKRTWFDMEGQYWKMQEYVGIGSLPTARPLMVRVKFKAYLQLQ